MLTQLYMEALLVDERLADAMWELWDAGLISNTVALIGWIFVITS